MNLQLEHLSNFEILFYDFHRKMVDTNATFTEQSIDLIVQNAFFHSKAALGVIPAEEFHDISAYTFRLSDIQKKKFNPKYINVHTLNGNLFKNSTLQDTNLEDIFSTKTLDTLNELKDKIETGTFQPYYFNTICVDREENWNFIASFRTPKNYGRMSIVVRHNNSIDESLLERVEVLESKCDAVQDTVYPSVFTRSIEKSLLKNALTKANNPASLNLFESLRRQFAAVDDAFNVKPEKYTAFAITQEASKILVDNFIIGPDGNPITEPDIQAFKQIIEYHIVPRELRPEDIRKNQILTSYNGIPLKVHVKGQDVFVNKSKILTPEGIEATNGIMYVIDTLLDPLDGVLVVAASE